MASVTATINVQINAANAAAQLTALQGKVAAMNKGVLAATAGGVMAQEKAIRRMGNVLTGSGSFTTGIRNVHTELGRLHNEFDRGTTSLQNYRRNSQMFSKDHSQINRMAADRVRMMQSQYVALGKEMNGVQKAMQIKPTGMMKEFGAETMYANQRATLFRRNLQMGSTALVNWGKNTQWAGRQMMVGMGIPIAIAAAGAIKAYNDIEAASISFKRVYGDTTTDAAEKTRMLGQVHDTVGKEMMKYGVAMSDTLDVSAKAAATGAKGADLIAATRETMRLATLGNMDYNKALEATIAMQTAFNINSKDMANTTDFLNAVENQTILSMEDMALAVPRVAPVIKGLGGDVKDLAIMMTALRQGGVSAEQGANALKSGLGSLLNPTGTAIDQFDQMGINLKKIVDTNKGDLIGTLQGLGKALGGLTKYDRQRALESLFGKYQYARMGALLKNINSKAVKETMKMAKAGAGELAKMSAQELSQISDSPMIKLRSSIEELKAAAAPLGALFSDIGAAIIRGITPVVDFFANNDAAKWGLVATAGFAAIAGTVTMVVGVLANFAGSMVKAGMALKSFFRFATGQRSLSYVATDELNASAAANSLATASERAATGLYAQANAAKLLTSQLEALIAAQTGAAATATGRGGGVVPRTNAPVPTAPRVTEAQMVSMLKTSGETVRAHVGQPMILSKAAEDALRATYLDANGNPLASKKQRAIDVQAGLKNGTIRGYSAMTLGWGSKTNNALSLRNKDGVPTQNLLDQLRMRPEEVMAPLLDDLARDSNMTTAQLIADDKVQKWADSVVRETTAGIANAGVSAWHDPDVAKVVDPILQRMSTDLPEKYRPAIEKMLLPEQILTHPGAKRFEVSKEVAGKAPEAFATPRPKEASTAKALEAAAPLAGKLGSLPQVQIDSNGKPVAVVHPKGSATPQTVDALKPKTIRPAMPMKIAYSEQASRAISDRGPTAPAGRQFSGMGLMGAGMLASTAFMGMEMAGKQVPAAATFAANGLMGIGMAAQMFPNATAALSAKIAAASVPFGPMGVAAGALALVVAGGVISYKKMLSDARKRGNELGEAFAGTTEFVKQAGAAYQKTSIVDQQLAEAKKTSVEQIAQGEQLLESDYGKQLVSGFNLVAERFGVQVASQQFTDKIVSAMVEGTMSGSDARGLLAALPDQTAAAMITKQIENIGGGKFGGISKNPTEAALKIMNRTANDIKLMSDFVARREEVFAQQDISAGSLESKANEIMRADKSNVSNQEKWIRAQQQAVEFYQKRSAEADQLGVSGINNEQLMQENSALVGQVWSESMKTAYRNRIAAEAQLNSQRQELKGLDPKSKEAITLKGDIQEGIKNIQEYDAANEKMVDGILDGYERMAQGGKTDPAMAKAREGMYGAVYDDVGKSIGPLGKLALEAAQGAGLSSRMEFEVALRMSTGELDPSLIFAAATGQKSLNVPMVLDITDKFGADKAGQFFSQILSMKDGAAEDILSGINTSGIKKIATDAGFSSKAVSRLIQSLKGLSGAASGGRGTSVPIPKVPKVDPNAGDSKRGNQAWGARYAAQARSAAKTTVGGAASAVQKIKTSWAKPSNAGALKPSSPVKVPVKYGEPKGEKSLKPKVVKIPVKYDQPRGEKALKPDPVQVKVSYDVTKKLPKPEPTKQSVDRMVGKVNLPKPNNTIQAVDRQLGSTNLPPIPDAIQYVKRVPKNAMGGEVVTGFFATGGSYHSGPGAVSGPGGPTDDKINARLSDGEYVIRASSVKKYGTDFMSAVNTGKYPGYAKGGPPIKGGLPPKESDAEGRQADFNNEYRSMIWEVKNFVKEFTYFGNIMASSKFKGVFKEFSYDFSKYLVDTFSPKQIQKLYQSGDIKNVRQQFKAQQRFSAMDEMNSSAKSASGITGVYRLLKEQITDKKGMNRINAVAGMSPEQYSAYSMMSKKKKAGYLGNLTESQRISTNIQELAERRQRIKDTPKAYRNAVGGASLNAVAKASGATPGNVMKYASALGMSLEELNQQVEDGSLPINFEELGKAAVTASQQLEILGMSASQKTSETISNNQSLIDTTKSIAEASARQKVKTLSFGGVSGKSQNTLEAESAQRDANNAIAQAQIDDINEKYDKQLNIVDQISQYQQAIANLERGRLTVAGALSQGDIATAAAAAQQQRTDTASFMQGQMRTQLENQQKAATLSLQNQINANTKLNRDIQNQIALAIADANAQTVIGGQNILDVQNGLIDNNDALILQETYWQQINAEIAERNRLLAETASVNPAPAPVTAVAPEATLPDDMNVSGGVTGAGKKKKKKGKGRAFGGWVPGRGNGDTVPLMATPGEFVVRKGAAARFGPTLKAMNSGSIKSPETVGGNVNIDNIIFQINGTNLNERDIADIAVRKMKGLDSATIRGGRF